MIASLKGVIQVRDAEGIVLDVNGVGHRLTMSTRSLSLLGAASGAVFLYTHLHVREDVLSLYGFVEQEEKEFFEILKGVSGVGPKVAVAILSAYSPADLRRGVLNRDIALFESISGIGKKTAERLVLELKDKVGEVRAETAGAVAAGNGNYYLAREALITLGYNFAEAEAALTGADPDMAVEELVKG
ncbi:MAG: Holliday junction branch migration protein RuvA, partial [Thermoleophilia bacterium]|nr:Holliday junction branch migration protein RuvA [Thermoleophilia bacterium]